MAYCACFQGNKELDKLYRKDVPALLQSDANDPLTYRQSKNTPWNKRGAALLSQRRFILS
jgi:hypothetical protein